VLVADIFDPDYIFDLISQCVPTSRQNLEPMGWADYLWYDASSKPRHIERKQAGELVGGMDEVERQLRKYLRKRDAALGLLIEGTICPLGNRSVWTQRYDDFGNPDPKGGREFRQPYQKVAAWLWVLDKLGVTIYRTLNQRGTAEFLVAAYRASQKEKHTTLQRYHRQLPPVWEPNPSVETLMGIVGVNLGPVRAEKLIQRFGTVWGVLSASKEDLVDVKGVEAVTVEKLMKAIGRGDE